MTNFLSTFDRLKRFFRKHTQKSADPTVESLPNLDDDTRVRTLLEHFPDFRERIESRFGVKWSERDESLSLRTFATRHGLPSPSVLYMALRLDQRFERASGINAEEVRRWRSANPRAIVLDCRERWELESPALENARAMDEATLNELTNGTSRDVPLLLYCHHGLRSADVAAHLADIGFADVRWIVGGIDRYAATVDRSIARYEAPPC